jgi:hypothetical protein
MDHIRVLRRAFSITLNYRALWVFGILLALTAGGRSSGGSNGGGSGSSGNGNFPPSTPPFPDFPRIPNEAVGGIIAVIVGLMCFFVLLGILFTILRYISETALIRMVNEHENTGEKVGIRQGFRLGWSRGAVRMFLIDLIFTVGGMVLFVLLLAIALAPLLLWATRNEGLGILGTVMTIGMALFLIFIAILIGIALSLVSQFMRRAAVLEDRGVFEAIRRGFELVRSRLGDVVVMGLILFGLGLAWVILMIPVFILLLLAGLAIGGLPALLVAFVTSRFIDGAVPWIIAALIGFPVFFLVLGVPALFLNGLAETFKSSTWTLTFREVLAMELSAPAGIETPISPAVTDDFPPDEAAEV